MKIRRSTEEAQRISDASRKAAKQQETSQAAAEQALDSNTQQRVDLSVSKTLLAIEEEGRGKVERLKGLYAAGELNYSGQQVAASVARGITEEVTYAFFDNNDEE